METSGIGVEWYDGAHGIVESIARGVFHPSPRFQILRYLCYLVYDCTAFFSLLTNTFAASKALRVAHPADFAHLVA